MDVRHFVMGVVTAVFACPMVYAENHTYDQSSVLFPGQMLSANTSQNAEEKKPQITGTGASGEAQTAVMDQYGRWHVTEKPKVITPVHPPTPLAGPAPKAPEIKSAPAAPQMRPAAPVPGMRPASPSREQERTSEINIPSAPVIEPSLPTTGSSEGGVQLAPKK